VSVDVLQVRQAARGDRSAFAGLYDAWSAPLFAYLVALLRRREEAEDALHDAFLSAWTRLPTLRDLERFVPWLFRIARNAALSARRRPHAASLGTEPLARPSAVEHADATALLADLAPDVRAVLLLRYIVGWGVEQTAEALDTSTATVKRHTASGLERLRARLEGTTP
jgi:RNA polymerase sigma-70 factor (ECF subfamily)